jgi:hypothetical protein
MRSEGRLGMLYRQGLLTQWMSLLMYPFLKGAYKDA